MTKRKPKVTVQKADSSKVKKLADARAKAKARARKPFGSTKVGAKNIAKTVRKLDKGTKGSVTEKHNTKVATAKLKKVKALANAKRKAKK